MKAPKLLENESAKSFKQRVAAWEKKTGQKYPQSFTGQTDEERILSGAIQMGSAFESKQDYSKDYDLDQIAKEESLSPKYYQSYRDSKEGKKFSKEQEEIQSNIDQDLKEESYTMDYSDVVLSDDEGTEDDTAVIEQTPTGDDGVQANAEDKAILKRDIDHQIAVKRNEQYLKSVSWDGMNRTYTTKYREAVKNAAGWSKFYDETDELGNPIEKSDVFTRGEDGLPLGVMGRSQRRAYDMKMHEAKMATKAQMEDSGRSESDVKAINSKEGLETVIDGGESAKTDVAKGSQPNIIEPPEREEIKLPGGS